MQRRCAVIPQISETQIALKIGIQLAETIPSPESGIDPAEIAALKLAAMLGEGSIVVAESVVNGLTSVLRDTASPVTETSSDVAALSIDWQRVPMGRLPKSPATRASVQRRPVSSIPASITLTQGDRQFNFGNNHPVITLGRDAKNNVMVSDLEASRQHCKIIYQRNGYVLVDLSTNGTYVAAPGQKEQHVRRAMISLPSRGHISLGHTCRAADPSTLAFEIKGGD
jgi:adenylate cyclase